MSLFENQIEYSKKKDEEELANAYIEIAGAVIGQKLQQAWQDESYAAKTALEDVCKYYRLKPREIPGSFKTIEHQLDYALGPCGITRRTIKLKKGWHKNAFGAMLATRKSDKKAVALIPGKMGGYTFRDAESGKFVKVTSKNAETLDEEALVFYRPFPLRAITLKDIVSYMQSSIDFIDVFWYFVSLGLATLLGLLMPKLTNILFAQVTVFGNIKLLIGVMVFMVTQTISVQFINGIKEILLSKIGTKLKLSIQSASIMRLFSMPTSFFRKYSSGELNQHILYINQLCDSLVNSIFATGITGVFSLVYITQIFHYSRSLVIPSLLIILATVIFGIVSVIVNIRVSRQLMDVTSHERGMVFGIISGIQKIRLCGAESRTFARWGNLYAKEARLLYSPPAILQYGTVINMAIGSIGTVILYYIAVKNNISVANFYSFSSAYAYISAAFASFVTVTQAIATIKPVINIIKPLMDTSPELSQDKEVVTRLSGSIELNHIFFKYPDNDQLILNDISLKINPGQYVAIVGESGCGKTTLLRVLLGFEKAQKGAIYYDGKNMDTLDIKSLRRKIGVVMQDSSLMLGSIYDNIIVSAPWLTLDEAWQAAEIAGIDDSIRAMPMGMHTVIQEGSGGISGGQRQRIMIARAVAPKPKILFLDEATSALDNITQKKVSESLDKMKCTRIVIAHRLSTIRQCDRILLLKDGKLAEDGTYDELIEKNGLFADLVRRQMVDPQKG